MGPCGAPALGLWHAEELLSRCPSANLEPEPLEVIGGEALEEEPWRQTTDPAV